MVEATFRFYVETVNGLFRERAVYKVTENTKADVNTEDVIWKAIEVEQFADNIAVLVEVSFLDTVTGTYLDSDECMFIPTVIRTSEPSDYIGQNGTAPTVFKVDREKSSLTFVEY